MITKAAVIIYCLVGLVCAGIAAYRSLIKVFVIVLALQGLTSRFGAGPELGSILWPALGSFFSFWIAKMLAESARQHDWKAWERAHSWPLKDPACTAADEFIKIRRGLGEKATPEEFQRHIFEQSGKEFPVELCRLLLNEVAGKGKDQARPPIERRKS